MNNYKISALSFSFIVICLLETNLLGTIFPFIIENTRYSFIYCLVLSFIIGLILLLLFLKVFSCLPSKNIIEKIDYVFLSFYLNQLILLLL